MAKPKDGDFYIQKSNQDFWLREDGAWVRKGNIRDEGASGIVSVNSVTSVGFAMNTSVDRWRFLGSLAMDLGLTQASTVTVSQALRLLAVDYNLGADMVATMTDTQQIMAAFMDVGMSMSSALTITQVLESIGPVDMSLGFLQDTTLTHQLVAVLAADMLLGFDQTVTVGQLQQIVDAQALGFDLAAVLTRARQITDAHDMGFTMSTTVLSRTQQVSDAFDLGFTQSTALLRIKAIAAAHALGFDMTSPLTRTQQISDAHDMGFIMSTAVITRTRQVSDAFDLGFLQSTTLSRIKAITAANALGFDMLSPLTRTQQITDAMAVGFSTAVSVTHAVPSLPKFLVIGLGASPWVLWYDSSVAAMSAPATGPTAAVKAIAFSPDGSLCVIATSSTIYRYDTSTATPSYLGAFPSPPSWAHIEDLSFNDAGTRLMVIDSQLSPYYWIYNTSTWASVTAPTGVAQSLSADWDDTSGKMVIGQGATTIKLVDTAGMTSSATQPGTQPSVGAWLGVGFDPSGTYFAAYASANPSPLRVWKMSALSAPLANPGTMPHINSSTVGRCIGWNPAGTKFAICEDFGTSIYNVSGTTVSLDTQINYNVIAGGQPMFRKDGAKLFLTQRGSAPRFAIYTVSGWTKDTNPTTQPATDPTAMASSI